MSKNFAIYFCIFGCYYQSFISRKKTGHQAESQKKFEIFLTSSNVLKSQALLHLKSAEAIHIQNIKFYRFNLPVTKGTCTRMLKSSKILWAKLSQNFFLLFSPSIIIQVPEKSPFWTKKRRFYTKPTIKQNWKLSKVNFWPKPYKTYQ